MEAHPERYIHNLNTISYYNKHNLSKKGCIYMDENNNSVNQENGFIMRDTPASEPEQNTTYRWSRPQANQDAPQPVSYTHLTLPTKA